MRRLILRTRNSDERGAVAVIVALCLAMFLGFGAIVIDVGALYRERRELQNGADAAALAIAKDCALGDCGDSQTTATDLADANADDDTSTVDGVTIDMSASTAKVDTSTSDLEGGTIVISRFGGLVGIDGSTVRASATARWGPLSHAPTVPLTISQCEWENAGGTLGDENTAPTLPSGSVTFTFHDGNDTEPCHTSSGSSGSDLPGGFGWLASSGACETTSEVDGWVDSGPGASPPNDCSLSDFLGQEVHIPVFKEYTGQGNNGRFLVWGYATIRITGVRLLMGNTFWSGGDISSCDTGTTGPPEGGPGGGNGGGPGSGPGSGSGSGPGSDQACLVGEFINGFIPAGSVGGAGTPNLGTVGVELIA